MFSLGEFNKNSSSALAFRWSELNTLKSNPSHLFNKKNLYMEGEESPFSHFLAVSLLIMSSPKKIKLNSFYTNFDVIFTFGYFFLRHRRSSLAKFALKRLLSSVSLDGMDNTGYMQTSVDFGSLVASHDNRKLFSKQAKLFF